MPIGIDTNNFDISMGTGVIQMSGGGTFTSDNSINYDWISRASPADCGWNSVAYGNGLFVAVSGSDGSNNSVMTSPDGINWTLRTTPSPGSAWESIAFGNGVFVAVGGGGTKRVITSTNGISWTERTSPNSDGNNWKSVAYGTPNGIPTFVAVCSFGTNRIMSSIDNGTTWSAITTYDSIPWQAVTYGNDRFVIVPTLISPLTYNVYALYSTNGTTWSQSGNILKLRYFGLTYGNGLFVAVAIDNVNINNAPGTGGQQLTSRVMTSPDGITWTIRYAPDIGWYNITYGGGMFVAVAIRGVGNRVMTSSDGINWTLRPSANDSIDWKGITYGNGIFVAVGVGVSGNRVMTLDPAYGMSINKITTEETTTNLVKFGQNGATISANPSKNFAWVSRSAAENNAWNAVCYGNSRFVAVAYTGTNRVMTSSDGYNWVARTAPQLNSWSQVCYGELSGNNLYVAVSWDGVNRSMYSSDGVTWTLSTPPATENWVSVCFGYDTSGNGRFVAVADQGSTSRTMFSPNGINWTPRNVGNSMAWADVCYGYDSSGQGQFVAVGYNVTGNRSMYSIDGGFTWVGKATTDDTSNWKGICYGNGTFVAVADAGTAGRRVMYSRNIIGAGWSNANYPVENGLWSVSFGNGLFVAVATTGGTGNRVMTSPDGINWTIRASAADNGWRGICYGNGTFVAVSFDGTITTQVMTNDYTANDNMLILNGGISSVGIGTNKPRTPLDVTGGISSNGRVDVSNVLMLRSQNTVGYNQTSTLGFGYAGGSTNGTEFRWKVDDITYNRDSGAGPNYDYGAQSKLIFSCKSNNLYNGVANDKLYQDGLCLVPNSAGNGGLSTGINVGIGKTSPSYSLDVSGTISGRTVNIPGNGIGMTYGIQVRVPAADTWVKLIGMTALQAKVCYDVTGSYSMQHDYLTFGAKITVNNFGDILLSQLTTNSMYVGSGINNTNFWGTYFDLVHVYNAAGNIAYLYAKLKSTGDVKLLGINVSISSKNATQVEPVYYGNTFALAFSSSMSSTTDPGLPASVTNLLITTTGKHIMTTNEYGQVGIGTTSPAATLDVNGTLRYSGSSVNTPKVIASGTDVKTVPAGNGRILILTTTETVSVFCVSNGDTFNSNCVMGGQIVNGVDCYMVYTNSGGGATRINYIAYRTV